LVIDLEETEANNNCPGEGRQQFNRPTDRPKPVCRESREVESSESVVSRWETDSSGVRRRRPPLVESWEVEEPTLFYVVGNVELVVRQSQASKNVSMEAEVATKLEAVIRQQVKTQQTEDLVHAVINCKVCQFVKRL
jgi:hypothetical protein